MDHIKPSLHSRRTRVLDRDPNPTEAVPFGLRGVGLLTGHPVGLLVVIAVCFVAWTLPEARWFTLASVLLGALAGLVLAIGNRRRQQKFDSTRSLLTI